MNEIEDWITNCLGKVASITMGQSPDSKYYSEEETGLSFLQGCSEFQARLPKPVLFCSQTKKVATSGSILFSVRAPVGRINIADRDYIIGRGLAGISANGIDQNYLEYYLAYCEPMFRNASQGSTFEAINSVELNCWPIKFPISKQEQEKIAETLSIVDQAIEQTEALIAKQQLVEIGFMRNLLTRGIDVDGNLRSEQTHKFKDSPLGRVPEEWEVVELSSVTPSPDSITYGVLKPGPFFEAGTPLLQITDVIHGDINVASLHRISPELDSQYKRTRLEGGELVVSLVGTIGRIAYIPYSLRGANLHRNLALVRIVEPNSIRFMFHYLRSNIAQKEIADNTLGSTQALLNLSNLRSLRIIQPTPTEQIMIAKKCDAICSSLSNNKLSLYKLRRLKNALMQDLLTGKKRVTLLLNETEVRNG